MSRSRHTFLGRLVGGVLMLFVLAFPDASGQVKLLEGFEAAPGIPSGWSVWNNAPFPIDPQTNWVVRDSGETLPGVALGTARVKSGRRAAGVSWWSSIDTTGGSSTVADAWLVTRKVMTIESGDVLRFWATGGNSAYLDSLQIWISPVDSTPAGMLGGIRLGSIVWPVGSSWGAFSERTYNISIAAGLNVWIGFRYFMNCTVNGLFVHIDDVSVENPNDVRSSSDIPAMYSLSQNYPNPFNPATTISFTLPSSSYTTLKVFDLLGSEVAVILAEELQAGKYSEHWNASGIPSGVYFYRLQAGQFTESRKLILLK